MNLPAAYQWIKGLGTLPRMLDAAVADFGIHEGAGALNNPVLLGWAQDLGLGKVYTADSIAWCGLAMAHWAKVAGKPVPASPLWALNWGGFGTEVHQPCLGDVLTFTRTGGGHVGMYVAEDGAAYHVIGGNEGDAVSIVRIAKTRLYRARRAPMAVAPASLKPFIVAATGTLSTNEA